MHVARFILIYTSEGDSEGYLYSSWAFLRIAIEKGLLPLWDEIEGIFERDPVREMRDLTPVGKKSHRNFSFGLHGGVFFSLVYSFSIRAILWPQKVPIFS